ncbi:MAG: DUF6434 domain-containing protein [Pseudomonadota bacterium]
MSGRRENRPDIGGIKTGRELRRWYWLKSELVEAAKAHGLKTTGGKFQILDRIAHFLDTGERQFPGDKSVKPSSDFDWHAAPLDDATVITDSYKNSQNVRRYFKFRLGDSFKFNTPFMEWMRSNAGKTLADACEVYPALKAGKGQSQIKDHNQFNQYTRDFLADNPDLGMDDVRRIWAEKRKLPSETGRHRYHPKDLDLV